MILVSAAIIRNTAGEILICQRGAGGSCAFLWEFPGGKQEAGETAADCLVRECREELGIEIDIVSNLLEQTSYTYPDNKIGLSFFAAKITGGVPQKSVHQKIYRCSRRFHESIRSSTDTSKSIKLAQEE